LPLSKGRVESDEQPDLFTGYIAQAVKDSPPGRRGQRVPLPSGISMAEAPSGRPRPDGGEGRGEGAAR